MFGPGEIFELKGRNTNGKFDRRRRNICTGGKIGMLKGPEVRKHVL